MSCNVISCAEWSGGTLRLPAQSPDCARPDSGPLQSCHNCSSDSLLQKDREEIPTFRSVHCARRVLDKQEPLAAQDGEEDKMGLGLLIWAALVFSLIAEPTLQIKLNNAGRGRNRNNAGGRHRTSSGLGVQIGRGRGIQIGRAGGGGRSSSRGDGDGGGGGGGGGGGLSVGGVFGGNNEDIRSRRPPRPPSDDYDETERETAGAQNSDRLKVSVAVVLPYSVFKKKSYTKKIIQV